MNVNAPANSFTLRPQALMTKHWALRTSQYLFPSPVLSPLVVSTWLSQTTMNPPYTSPSVAEVSNDYTEGASYEHQTCRPNDMMTAMPQQAELGPDIEVSRTNTDEQYMTNYSIAATEVPSQPPEQTPQQSAPGHTNFSNTTDDSNPMYPSPHQDGRKSGAEELVVLRQANAVLIQRLHELEGENPEERDARRLKLKNDEVEELKASVEQTHMETEIIKQTLAERQAYLRELNAQIADLQPPLPFAVKETRKKKDKAKGRK